MHCTTCGWPSPGPRCSACGAEQGRLVGDDGGRRLVTLPRGDAGGLERAFEAWRANDFVGAVGHCVAAVAADARTAQTSRGFGWVVPLGGAILFVALDARSGYLSVEAPLARLPKRQRVPVLRLCLERCDRPATASRIGLRGDLLLLRFVGRLDHMTPPLVRTLIRDAAIATEDAAAQLALFDARAVLTDGARREADWSFLGEPRVLDALAPRTHTSGPPLPDEFANAPPRSVAMGVDGNGSTPSTQRSSPDTIPPILAPRLVATGADVAPDDVSDVPTPLPREVAPGPRATIPDLDLDLIPTRRPTTAGLKRDDLEMTPADRLCEMLRRAQALATAVSLDERPATMLLLVRATVFRAIYEHGEAVPDAVARLYRESSAAMQSGWAAALSSRASPAMMLPVAEAALLVMSEIVRHRANVPKELPLTLEPLTSAMEVKQHLSRYVEEIARAPADGALRYFLGLGALMELVVRTKLPRSTEERVREIVRIARRDGAKDTSIELLMRSIRRIIGS